MTKEFDHSLRLSAPRSLSIQAALEWAFGAEHAQLDFDDLRPQGARPGCDTIYRMMQQGALGCQIDGGGVSRAADDAEVIANAVADLPVALGGRSMAVAMAGWARAGLAPDWMPDTMPRCIPRAWRNTKHGLFAKTESMGEATVVILGKPRTYEVVVCPITFSPTAQQIGMARRRYLGWYGALLHLRSVLCHGALSRLRLTNAMPPVSPWVDRTKLSDAA